MDPDIPVQWPSPTHAIHSETGSDVWCLKLTLFEINCSSYLLGIPKWGGILSAGAFIHFVNPLFYIMLGKPKYWYYSSKFYTCRYRQEERYIALTEFSKTFLG
jgi:hypothetical protein